jgi:hypothetical protein
LFPRTLSPANPFNSTPERAWPRDVAALPFGPHSPGVSRSRILTPTKSGRAVKDKLGEAFAAAKVRAEIEVYPNALHGWCVPDSRAADNRADAERAWAKLVALYKAAL